MKRSKLSASEFSRVGQNRTKAIQHLRDAESMQPWRCVKCGTAVRKGMNDLCPCVAECAKEKKT